MQGKLFKKILVANRGEIALRIMRTCREMGISSVAVYSDFDENALHTRSADEAVHIGRSPAIESYLNIHSIIQAALKTRVDAIHPGYGFLSENGDFAEACLAAGIAFIGPSADVIRKMGSKSLARQLLSRAGVPVVPGYDGDDQSAQALRKHALHVGFPILIKAACGGGGKGMRLVHAPEEFDEAAASARREAEKAFGDGTLVLEKYIGRARHVEFQILGDHRGNIVHLLERECSVQRRHQKIIEESPSPALGAELRGRMGEAAIEAARAIGYTNAGTVEFILAPSGEFYFIEVNTRLQVEHPVTEMTTGLDLVKLQIEIAEGKPLPLAQEDVTGSGHAIEARLYAESPLNDFLPAAGTVVDWTPALGLDGVRIDTGIETGSRVGIFYDPLLAKIIAWAPERERAIRKLVYALGRLSVQGVDTNRDFVIRVLERSEFALGDYDTGLVREHLSSLIDGSSARELSAAVVALYLIKTWQSHGEILQNIPPGYRNNPYHDPSIRFAVRDSEIDLSYHRLGDDEYTVYSGEWRTRARIVSIGPGSLQIEFDGVQAAYAVRQSGHEFFVHSFGRSERVKRLDKYPAATAPNAESANSPMPGQVIRVLVVEGQQVAVGQPLVLLEAMKMEQTVRAAVDGTVQAILVKAGDLVSPGEILIQIRTGSG